MKICAFCNIKDEQRYLEQWINHCLSIGINKIVLYEDINSKPHDEICNKYTEVELIKGVLETLPKKHTKDIDCWQDFIFRYTEDDVDWVMKLDPDEYIDGIISLQDLLALGDNVEQYYLKWHIHNANGLINAPKEYIYDIRNTYSKWIKPNEFRECKDLDISDNKFTLGKSIVRYRVARCCSDLNIMFPHLILKQNKFLTNIVNTNILYIDHYICKSYEEWLWRLNEKGISNPKFKRKIQDFFIINPEISLDLSL